MKIPKDSALTSWIDVLSNMTEVPEAFQILIGLSTLGTLLRRRMFFDQFQWRVYPNLSVLLIGPSGIGKDTVINAGTEVVMGADPDFKILSGRTIEKIFLDMIELGDPAACLILAPEMAAFLGTQDYQSGKMQDLTNLMSTNKTLDISTIGRGTQVIRNPTPTVWAGSTPKWLHLCMPEGALEGGFIPRFVVIPEDYTGRHIPLPKYEHSRAEVERYREQKRKFMHAVRAIIEWWPAKETEMFPLGKARDLFREWYVERIKRFAPTVADYAFRARDHVIRMAMLMAVSRKHNFMQEQDVQFGIDMMDYIAARLEQIIIMPTKESACMKDIMALTPIMWPVLLKFLANRYDSQIINRAKNVLLETGQIKIQKDGKILGGKE